MNILTTIYWTSLGIALVLVIYGMSSKSRNDYAPKWYIFLMATLLIAAGISGFLTLPK